MVDLRLNDLFKRYDDAQGTEVAVDHIDLEIEDGERLVLVGPSGCGKTTTLRCIAGLESTTDGTIEIGDREVQDLTPNNRDIAMVFQSYALYKKMTARANIGYGLKHSSTLSRSEREERVEEMAEMLGISELLDDRPAEMSGGQQQRVALGRAIIRDPEVFLLDEPLANLDAKLRARMRTELQRIHDELDVTMVYVTHDQKEAMTMGDKIAIMDDGAIQQAASPEEAYDHPNNQFVATFLGSPSMNVLEATVERESDEMRLTHDTGTIAHVSASDLEGVADGDIVNAGLRPEDFELSDSPGDGTFESRVAVNEYQGNSNFVHLELGDEELTAKVATSIDPDVGERVGVTIPREKVYVFDAETGDSLKTKGSKAAVSAQD
jgi:multiple sugar transport system ATP-binding protein